MVALKLGVGTPGGPAHPEKQERRGGIETRPGSIENIWRYGKQERRGGIETALACFLSRQSLDIAAPPQRGIPRIG